MANGLICAPNAGDGLSAAWARQLVEEVRSHRLNVCPPLMLSRTPAGTTLRIGRQAAATAPEAYPEPWSFSFDGAEVKFSNCVYMRGPVTAVAAPPACTVAGADGDIFLSAKINTETGACEIVEAATLALATDAAVPADEFVKVPLLKLTKKTTGEGEDASVSLSVALDLRRMMCLMLYV